MAVNSSSSTNAPKSSNEGKRILEELQRKASELSTILSSQATKPADTPTNQAGSTCSSSSRAYMPSFRRQFMSSPSPFRGKGKGKSVVKGPFMRDVILLTGPRVNSVPRQAKRVWLTEKGFVISGFQLQKEWSEFVVEASLREAFEEKIPAGVDFEILMPVHRFLRSVAYRWVVRWLCGYMGWDNTRPLPACVYHNLRKRFPSHQTQGYATAQERE